MTNNQTTYKFVKINWWIVLIFGGSYIWMIFAYIHQWGNNPIDKTGLIIFTVIWIIVLFASGRSKAIIDDKFVTFRTDLWIPIKIPFAKIKSVSIEQVRLMYFGEKNTERFSFDFVKQAVIIRLKSGKIYQIAIKDPQKIKEEIEKRMITTNNKPQ